MYESVSNDQSKINNRQITSKSLEVDIDFREVV